MNSKIAIFGVLAGLAAASPAPQMMEFGALNAAPSPSFTGPIVGLSNQTAVYTPTSVAVNSVATASITGAAATSAALKKRDPKEKETISTSSTSTSRASSSSTQKLSGYTTSSVQQSPTSSSSSVQQSSTSTTSSAQQTSASSSSDAQQLSTSSTSNIQQSSTTTSSSTTACPTTPEAGTYCGFINPEDDCAPQPDGYGPHVTPDTDAAFLAYQSFHDMALNVPTPSTYSNTFHDMNAAVSANSYLGLHTLKTYSAQDCAAWCDNTTLCTGFNLYIERDPSVNPSTSACPNPASITNYKCTLWGSGVDAASAVNDGQWRGVADANGVTFHVVITGSNGYSKINNTTPSGSSGTPGWNPPTNCSTSAIDKPAVCLGKKFFPGPYDPSVCASYAKAQTTYNRKAATISTLWFYTPCNMFNAYMVKRDGYALGTYCSLYDTNVAKKYATYRGGVSGGKQFSIESSWTYSRTNQCTGNTLIDKDD